MRKTLLYLVVLLSGVMITFMVSDNDAKHSVVIHHNVPSSDTSIFEEGDLILRRGKGLVSDLFRNASLHKREFSHAGLLFRTSANWYVVHMIGDGAHKGFKIELFSDFINRDENHSYAVYRYHFMKKYSTTVEQHLRKLSQMNLAFDDRFSLESDNELYCSEMIYKTIDSICKIPLPVTEVKGMTYVAIDNLYPEMLTTRIVKVTY